MIQPKNEHLAGSSQEGGASLIDVIVFAVGLASSAGALNPALDKMRAITAKVGLGEELTLEDKDALAAVYMEIETYLVTSEPVRKYSRQELRTMIKSRFEPVLSEPRFWSLIAKTA